MGGLWEGGAERPSDSNSSLWAETGVVATLVHLAAACCELSSRLVLKYGQCLSQPLVLS